MSKVISVILIWSCLSMSGLHSQTILSGEVRDIVGTPIVGAHVIIYDEDESILSFTFTDSLVNLA